MPEPVAESLDNGILGLTLVYETSEMAREITINWRLFSETVQKIEATTTEAQAAMKPPINRLFLLSPD